MKFLGVSFVALLAITSVYGEICTKPEVTASAYVTEDAMIHTTVAFTTQFVLKCSNGAKNIPLYAEIDGKTVPAVHLSTDNKYQVSWTEDVKKVRTGDYSVNLYDEEGYAAIRKAQRSGEDSSAVKPLIVVVVNNSGVYQGPWVNSEFLAALLAALVSYAAFSAKSKLLA